MSGESASTLEQAIAAVNQIVERLLALCRGFESDDWLAKFVAVHAAMSAGRFQDAVREEARLVRLLKRKWVVSRDLERRLEKAMGVLHRHVSYPGHSELLAESDDLPSDVTARGTIEEEESRMLEALRKSFRRDPLEDDPAYAEILREASEQAERELADHPLNGGFGFCHVFWRRKKEILFRTYGLEWRSPSEMNPGTNYD